MALPPIITYNGTVGPKTGTPATAPPKQTLLGPDTTSGVSATGTPKQAVPTVENQRGRLPERVDGDERTRSRSEKRRTAAAKAEAEKAAADKQTAEQAAAAEEEVQAAAPLAEAEALAAEAGGTQDPRTKPPQKTRNSNPGEAQAADDPMKQPDGPA